MIIFSHNDIEFALIKLLLKIIVKNKNNIINLIQFHIY